MSESPALKKKKIRHYNPSWLNDSTFKSWLFVGNQSQGGAEASASACSSDPKMFCSVCQKAGKSNIFTQGFQDYQRSALLRHIASSSHQDGLKILKGREEFQKAKASQVLKTSDALESQLKTAYFIAQNHLPLTIFPELIGLQVSNGAPNMTQTYKSYDAVSDMIESIASALDGNLREIIGGSRFVGLMTDESIDIAVLKKLVIYVKVVKDGKSQVYFATNVTVPDGKAETIINAITEWLASERIAIQKVLGFGSDGAAVMMGSRSGVGVRLKELTGGLTIHVHCYAHRLALAVSQAANIVDQIKSYQDTVNSIYFYFHNSAQRYNHLREIYDLLEDDKFVSLKQPHAVRWLSLDQAVYAINHCWPALVIALGEAAANGVAVARGLADKVEKYSFIGITCLLADILPNFSKMSKVFQRESLDFAMASTALDTVKATLTTMQVQLECRLYS